MTAADAEAASASAPVAGATRRTVLVAGMTAVGAAALAACSSGSGQTAQPGADSKASTGAGPGGAGADGGASGGTVLAAVADVPVGDAISAKLDGDPILISQPAAGDIVAFTAICTHMGCTVMPAGKEFHCPCHGSVYDAATGKVKQGPAPAALAPIKVHVAGGEVIAGA